MNIKSVFSTQKNVEKNIKELKHNLGEFDAKLVLYFASSHFSPESVSHLMEKNFKGASVFGCSTSGEITNGHVMEDSIVLMAFNEKAIGDVKIEVVENLKQDNGNGIEKAFASFENHFGLSAKEMNYKEYVGIVLFEMTSLAEERIMDKIGDLTNVVFIGATAGDDRRFEQTYVYANGKSYKDAAILALLKPSMKFDFIKTQSVASLGKSMIATKVDEEKRRVIEFDHQPAVTQYAELLHTTPEKLQDLFFSNPLGLIGGGGEIFVRSPRNISHDTMIDFYCNILEGMEVSCLETRDIVSDTKRDLENKQIETGTISGLIDFHCILRKLELQDKNQSEAYGNLFGSIPTIGFSTYGEQFIGHINQTSTMLIFF